MEDVMTQIRSLELCEVHFHDEKGTVIVTIEGRTTGEELDRLRQIQRIPHVLSVDLMYSYSEDELEEARELIRKAGDPVPARLKD